MNDRFVIEDFGSASFDKLWAQVTSPYFGNRAPLDAVISMLAVGDKPCRSALFEFFYVDKDYQDEFGTFYSKSFNIYHNRCTRVHFFSKLLPRRARINLRKYCPSDDDYIGFIVLRPTELQRMGRTIIKPVLAKDQHYIHCLAPFFSHILGEEFKVNAMPFYQQDTHVGACAHASLWMLARYMSHKFRHREHLPTEINSLAKANMALGRSFPADSGLNIFQMLDALKGMGFFAIPYDKNQIDDCSKHIDRAYRIENPHLAGALQRKQLAKRRTAKLADIAYRYIESGLPVIFGTVDHTLVGIGHTYRPDADATVAIHRIPAFYVHDDANAPYREVPIFLDSEAGYGKKSLSFEDVENIIAVLPSEYALRGEEAEAMAVGRIEELLAQRSPKPELSWKDLILEARPEFSPWLKSLEYRTYFLPSTVLQQELKAAFRVERSNRRILHRLIRLEYPPYVWVTELSSSHLLNHSDKTKRKCLGRVFMDGEAPSRTRGVLAVHFADILMLQSHSDEKQTQMYVPGSTPFPHRITP